MAFARCGRDIHHRGTGLLRVACAAVPGGAGAVARAVLRRCRVELQYWQRLRDRSRHNEAKLVLARLQEASGLLDGAPAAAVRWFECKSA